MQAILIPVVRTTITRLEALAAEDAAPDTDPLARSRELAELARNLKEALQRLTQQPRPTGATPGLAGDERLWQQRHVGETHE